MQSKFQQRLLGAGIFLLVILLFMPVLLYKALQTPKKQDVTPIALSSSQSTAQTITDETHLSSQASSANSVGSTALHSQPVVTKGPSSIDKTTNQKTSASNASSFDIAPAQPATDKHRSSAQLPASNNTSNTIARRPSSETLNNSNTTNSEKANFKSVSSTLNQPINRNQSSNQSSLKSAAARLSDKKTLSAQVPTTVVKASRPAVKLQQKRDQHQQELKAELSSMGVGLITSESLRGSSNKHSSNDGITAVRKKIKKVVTASRSSSHHQSLHDGSVSELKSITEKLDSSTTWVLQVGSFSSYRNANQLLRKLNGHGYHAFIHKTNAKLFKVFVGPSYNRAKLEKTKLTLASQFEMHGFVRQFGV